MKHVLNIFFISTLLVLIPFSCKKGEGTAPDMGYDYFPVDVGRYVVYDVDSTYYDDFYAPTLATNYKFQVKEKIESIFTDNEGRSTVRLERYVKHYDSLVPYSSMSWSLTDVWAENLTTTTAEKVEENVRFIRLVFPVREDVEWDVNVQNIEEERRFNYEYVDEPIQVGDTNFADVLKTIYDDEEAILTSREYRTEKYAKNVGMVYRREIVVESQPEAGASSTELQSFFAMPIMERITSGFQYTMTFNSYGIE